VARLAKRAAHREAPDRDRLASQGLQALLDLEEPKQRRTSTDRGGQTGEAGSNVAILYVYSLFIGNDLTNQRESLRNLEEGGEAARLEPWVMPFLEQILPTLPETK
jgi:hypothetical protein